jgi:hypothetical protein
VVANPRIAAGSTAACDWRRLFRGLEGKNIMKTSKSRWQLLTSEVIATPELSGGGRTTTHLRLDH